MLDHLREDIEAVFQRDPAARSKLEVILAYPSIHALALHRLAHRLWVHNWLVLARVLSHIGRVFTGIEIHPAAKIGRGVFIDHGMGVVVGETAEVGNGVTLYQGVTLGGVSLEPGKRHPTLEEGVIVGAGAKIIGPVTVGARSRVGSNAVVVSDVPADLTVVGVPARAVGADRPKEQSEDLCFCAYAAPEGTMPDPVMKAFEGLNERMAALAARVEELEGELAVARATAEGRGERVTPIIKASEEEGEAQPTRLAGR